MKNHKISWSVKVNEQQWRRERIGNANPLWKKGKEKIFVEKKVKVKWLMKVN